MGEIHSSSHVSWAKRMLAKLVVAGQKRFPKLYARMNAKASKPWQGAIPWTPVKKPLRESRVALVTSGGILLKGQPPFDLANPKGDCSYRVIEKDAPLEDVVISHLSYDHSEVQVDTEIMFPLGTLRQLAAERVIGSVAPRHFSFSGGIADPTPLVKENGPEVARHLADDQVDLAIFTPA